jgi:hypothetical protein
MAAVGRTADEMRSGGVGMAYAGSMLNAVIVSVVLSQVIRWSGAATIGSGMGVGLLAWLGFVATSSSVIVLFEQRPKALWVINNGYNVVGYVLMGALLATWR